MGRPRGSRKQREQNMRLATGRGRMIGYIRVSTQGQGTNGHSLAGQRTRLAEACEREGFDLVDVIEEVASGRKERDGLAGVQRRVLAGEAQGIVFPKIDRLGRSLIHLLRVVEWAEKERVDLLAADEGWQVRNGKKIDRMLPFRLAMAQVEADRISERTRDGLAAARDKGIRLGAPVRLDEALCKRAARLRRKGRTLQEIADALNAEGRRTPTGREFRATSIMRMIDRVDPEANEGKAQAAA